MLIKDVASLIRDNSRENGGFANILINNQLMHILITLYN
jgi:hypothetical protein